MLLRVTTFIYLLVFSSTVFAGVGKTLITKKLKPDIAKSYKKDGDKKYTFEIDPSKKVKSGGKEVALSFEMIESSLMKRLGKKFGAKVSGDAKKVTITFTKGSDDDFLKTVSKARIRPSKSINIASSVSDGGVRARTATRDPKSGEVKGSVMKVLSKDHIMVKILMKGSENATSKSNEIFKAVPLNQQITVEYKNFKGLNGQLLYFFPIAQKKDPKTSKMVWIGKDFNKK